MLPGIFDPSISRTRHQGEKRGISVVLPRDPRWGSGPIFSSNKLLQLELAGLQQRDHTVLRKQEYLCI